MKECSRNKVLIVEIDQVDSKNNMTIAQNQGFLSSPVIWQPDSESPDYPRL